MKKSPISPLSFGARVPAWRGKMILAAEVILGVAIGTAIFVGQSGQAATYTWSNTGTDWNNAASWGGSGFPGSTTNDVANFATAEVTNPNLSSSVSFTRLTAQTAATGYTLSSSSGSVSITLTGTLNGANSAVNFSTASAGATFAISAPIILGAANGTTQTFNANSANGTLTISGPVSSSNTVALNFTGAGTLILSSGANSYTGGTIIGSGGTGGVLQFASGALGTTGNITFSGGILRYAPGNTQDISARIVGSANAIAIDTNGNDVTFASALGSSNTGGLTKSGSGALTLSGNNSFSGGVNLTAGQLNINSATAIGTGAFVFGVNTTIDNTSGAAVTLTTNNAVTLNNFTFGGSNDLNFGTGAVSLTTNRVVTLNGVGRALTFGGQLQNTNDVNNPTLTVNGAGNTLVLGGLSLTPSATTHGVVFSGSGNLNITGAIVDGGTASTLRYTGSGTLTLGGTSSYTGLTTVISGTVLVNGVINGGVNVAGGTLGGGQGTNAGTIGGAVTVGSGATLAPGLTTGILNTGNLSLASGAAFKLELNGATAGSGYDRVGVTGAVSLDGDLQLTLGVGFVPVNGETFTLLANDGTADAINGIFASVNGAGFGAGNTFTLTNNTGTYNFQLFYSGEGGAISGGNDLVLQAVVPEPGAVGLLTVGMGLLGLRRRRSRN